MSKLTVHHLTVERTARVVTLGGVNVTSEGAVPDPSLPEECWVVCHGYRQLAARFARRFKGISGPNRQVVAPEALSRFYVDRSVGRHGPESRVGATWMTREEREEEIRDYVAYLDQVGDRFMDGAVRRTALGFSQGVHTVARWVTYGRTPVDRLILWGAYLPPDLDLAKHRERLGAVEMVQVQGEADGSRSELLQDQQDERVAAAGLTLRKLTHPGGHDIDADLLTMLASEIRSG